MSSSHSSAISTPTLNSKQLGFPHSARSKPRATLSKPRAQIPICWTNLWVYMWPSFQPIPATCHHHPHSKFQAIGSEIWVFHRPSQQTPNSISYNVDVTLGINSPMQPQSNAAPKHSRIHGVINCQCTVSQRTASIPSFPLVGRNYFCSSEHGHAFARSKYYKCVVGCFPKRG